MKTRLALALLATAVAALAELPTRTDATRPDLPYNPGRYDHEGQVRLFTTTAERDAQPAFHLAKPIEYRVSKAANATAAGTRERLLALFAVIGPAHSFDIPANKAVPKDKKGEEAGTLYPLDREKFVDALKGGQEFTVTLIEKRRCPACHGEGVLRPRVEHGEKPDTPRKDWKRCPWSDGGAEADFAVTYTVKW